MQETETKSPAGTGRQDERTEEAVGIGGNSDGAELVRMEVNADASLSLMGPLEEEARGFVEASKADNTRRAYKADWKDFTDWCQWRGRTALPATPETITLYLTDIAKELKASTLQRRIASIAYAHAAKGHKPDPTKDAIVRAVWQGIRRSKGVAMEGKSPTLMGDIRLMVEHLPEGKLIGVRDRALLLLGFAGAMRRSELVSLDVDDVALTEEGLVVTIRRSKTDQEGAGRKVGIPYGSFPQTCPVRSLQKWLAASGITEGPLFRSVNRHGKLLDGRLGDRAVALVVKRALEAAGKDPELVKKFAGHSLRAGLATAAAMAGASERSIQEQTGHKSLIILRRYIREGSLFRENAAAQVGL